MKIPSGRVFNAPPAGAAVLRRSATRSAEVGADRVISYVFSTPDVGRDMHVIAADAWKIDNFLKNPVALWNHSTGTPPIGRVVALHTAKGELRGGILYATADENPLADSLFRMVKGGFLNATSTSWRPLEWKISNDRKRPGGVDFSSVELLEISNVSVPALPAALATARASGFDVSPFIGWADRALDARASLSTRKELEMIRRSAGAPKVYPAPKRAVTPPPSPARDPLPISPDERERRARALLPTLETDDDGGFDSFGDFARCVVGAGAIGGRIDERLSRAPHGLYEQDPTAGGFLVPVQFADRLIGSLYEESRLLPLVSQSETSRPGETRIPTISEKSRQSGSRWGGVVAYWSPGEGASVTPSLPIFDQVTLDPKKLIGVAVSSEELIRDVPLLSDHLTRAFKSEFGYMIDAAILSGAGDGLPLGILNSPALITVAKDTGQTSGTITASNIDNMWSRIAFPCRRRAVWLVGEDVDKQLAQMLLAGGAAASASPDAMSMYVPAGANGLEFATLKGRPVIEAEQCSPVGTPGDIVLADMSAYMVISRPLSQALSLDVNFTAFQGVFRWTWRIDGSPLYSTPILSANGTSPRSPFVALAAR